MQVTVDNLFALEQWGDLWREREIFVRIDTGAGAGHHHHVRTAGAHAKFGVPIADLDDLERLTRRCGARIVGLHSHVGSGILTVRTWEQTARRLAELGQRFEAVRAIDIGGGLGIPERADQHGPDLNELDTLLAAVRAEHPRLE
ncbi:diaminopimelate decarboxylase, partial [mine drainage metagenome]